MVEVRNDKRPLRVSNMPLDRVSPQGYPSAERGDYAHWISCIGMFGVERLFRQFYLGREKKFDPNLAHRAGRLRLRTHCRKYIRILFLDSGSLSQFDTYTQLKNSGQAADAYF
ncbi:MAG: hypothetical protein ACRERV_03085 [Methylococcales bacterium]